MPASPRGGGGRRGPEGARPRESDPRAASELVQRRVKALEASASGRAGAVSLEVGAAGEEEVEVLVPGAPDSERGAPDSPGVPGGRGGPECRAPGFRTRKERFWLGLAALGAALLFGAFLVGVSAFVEAYASVRLGGAMPCTNEQGPEMATLNWCPGKLRDFCAEQIGSVKTLRTSFRGAVSKGKALRLYSQIALLLNNLINLSRVINRNHPDPSLRSEGFSCARDAEEMANALSSDALIMGAFHRVKDEPAGGRLEDRLYERVMRGFRRSGFARSSAVRSELVNLRKDIAWLEEQYTRNLAGERPTVTVPRGGGLLRGINPELVEGWASGTNASEVVFPTAEPHYSQLLVQARDRALRGELYHARRRAAAGENLDVLTQLLNQKARFAELLGYRDWASYSLEAKLMENATRAAAYVAAAQAECESAAQRDLASLLTFQEERFRNGTVHEYDVPHFEARAKYLKFNVTYGEISNFFTYSNTKRGILDLLHAYFEVQFTPVLKDVWPWHQSVEVYDVVFSARPGTRIGRIYLDMVSRPKKLLEASQFALRAGVEGAQVPEVVLMANVRESGPIPHSQVAHMFHQFGHAMHHILGGQNQKYVDFSGVATEPDFVEAPAYAFEEWASDKQVLEKITKDPFTGQPMPDELMDKLIAMNKFGGSYRTCQETFLAQLALDLHGARPPEVRKWNGTVILEREARTFAAFSPYAAAWGSAYCPSFPPLAISGPAYYKYQLGRELGALIYQEIANATAWAYRAQPRFRKAAWGRFADTVLRPGGQRDATDLLRSFFEGGSTAPHAQRWGALQALLAGGGPAAARRQ